MVREDVRFMLPKAIRQAMAATASRLERDRPLRTLVVSDLHLGARREPDVLRRQEPRDALIEARRRRAIGWCCWAT